MSNKGQVLTRDLTLLVLAITASRNGATSARTQRTGEQKGVRLTKSA